MPPEVYKHKLLRDSLTRAPYEHLMRKDSGPTGPGVVKEPVVVKKDSTQPAVVKPIPKPSITKKSPLRAKTNLPKKVKPIPKPVVPKKILSDSARIAKADSMYNLPVDNQVVQGAANMARQIKSQVMNANLNIENYEKELAIFEIQWHKILASSFACIAMFLIGAPLGAIIKKGGLGVPFLVSIFFFIVYYVITMQGEKLAKQNTVSVAAGVWAADIILLFIGLVFLRQARIDARLFEADFYSVVMDKLKQWIATKRQPKPEMV